MTVSVGGWQLQVERGPDWLFVKPIAPQEDEGPIDLALLIWDQMQQHFTHRVVIEMDQIGFLSSHLIGQLIMLVKRVRASSGVLRICSLSEHSAEALHLCRLDQALPSFANRVEAVQGEWRPKPR